MSEDRYGRFLDLRTSDSAIYFIKDIKTGDCVEFSKYIYWCLMLLPVEGSFDVEPYAKMLKKLDDMSYGIFDKSEEGCLEHIYELRDDFLEFLANCAYAPNPEIAHWESLLAKKRPSVLELLVAVSVQVEKTLMQNPKYGDRTGKWFWMMITNLDLNGQTNDNYDEEYVEKVINRWLNHEFAPNGDGSPFPLKHPPANMRGVGIYQAFMWYLTENFEGKW